MGQLHTTRRRVVEIGWVAALVLGAVGVVFATQPVQTRKTNFFNAGTQPNQVTQPLIDPLTCSFCHGGYDEEEEQWYRWNHSLMGQSGRDPVFYAALAIAEQDASYVAELCMRCHTPNAWLQNKVKFTDDPQDPDFGKLRPLASADLIGVSCSVCHRMVDPVYQPGVSPVDDLAILSGLSTGVPINPHNANYIIDPEDRRRGPFNLDADWVTTNGWPGFHEYRQSPFHLSSRMCATCHDVSSVHFRWDNTQQSYRLLNQNEQPAANKYESFPEQRTFSEWAASLFGQGPVNLNGRFGGNHLAVSSCQDCHMPAVTGQGCAVDPPVRNNLPQHNFNGANTWVLRAINHLYPTSDTNMDQQGIDQAIARTTAFLQAASDMELTAQGGVLKVRVINFSGHKLPTGYNEGRRMWINVKFKNAAGQTIAERGAYDFATAVLNEGDTKVYEGKIGPDATVAAAVGTTAGPTFRLAISNKWYKDNRIPPMGYNRAAFEAVQAGHVPPNLYQDGQYWDDTYFFAPSGARSAEVRVYYQTTTKEYIEFLRDANTDPNPATNEGQIAYNMWTMFGKSEPVVMDNGTINLVCRCDFNGSGMLEVADIFDYLNAWFAGSANADFDQSGSLAVADLFDFLNCWFASCAGY